MFQIHSWPNVILHLDGDAFFASVMQSANPYLKGKPLVTGSERGIATAISYEAKKYGIPRGMPIYKIKKLYPQCQIMETDYELVDLYSKKMFDILRSLTLGVEEYSVDEGFTDLKGLQKPLNMNYYHIGENIKDKIESSLGITVSVGISLTKSLAKLASSFRKPSGLTVVKGAHIEKLLQLTPIQSVWGIGYNTASYLKKLSIKTALDFALKPEKFIKNHLSKPYFEIWKELKGDKVYELNIQTKTTYKGISDTGTFRPPTNNKDILWAKLLSHVEEAFQKARRYHYSVGKVALFLKTQEFHFHTSEIKLQEKLAYPYLIREELRKLFNKIHKKNVLYRATGCHIFDLEELTSTQPSLFSDNLKQEKMKKIYPLLESKKVDFGTTLFDNSGRGRRSASPTIKELSLPILSLNEI
ncbi:MAG: DNA polymerase IV [Candidatus Roizmanbacteria bacterium]|nr:MAG: DNA polymerase IV [Candidatus Roizmanbacteria bacterium]